MKKFEIPIKEYEKDLETKSAKGKKKEILDLFKHHNKLRSEEDFRVIKENLHFACREGNLELIKIYLNESIVNDSETLELKIDETNRTASISRIAYSTEKVIFPRTYQHGSSEYLITSMIGNGYDLRTLKFSEDSAVKTIYRNSLYLRLEEIYFPSSLKELKKGWCYGAKNLTKITISPKIDHFAFKNNKYLIGKSDENNDEFDILLFASRDIDEIVIPSSIKIISSYAFKDCDKLTKVEFETNSNLQIIESYAFDCYNLTEFKIPPNSNLQKIGKFSFCCFKIKEICFPESLKELKEGWCSDLLNLTKITISPKNDHFVYKDGKYLIGKSGENNNEFDILLFASRDINEIVIPSSIKIISSYAFQNCDKLTKVEFETNSYLQRIGNNAFSYSNIKEIVIPSKVSKISTEAFHECHNLTKVEIFPKSNLQKIGKNAFSYSNINRIFIPSKVSIICEEAFYNCAYLSSVEFEADSNLQTIENHSFSYTNINRIIIPPKVSKIGERAFAMCKYLNKIDFATNSNLQTIEKNAFCISKSKGIIIPPKLSKIGEQAFSILLQIIEISEDSILESIPLSAFSQDQDIIIMIPLSKKKLII